MAYEYFKAKLKSNGDKAFWIGKLSDKCLPIRILLTLRFIHFAWKSFNVVFNEIQGQLTSSFFAMVPLYLQLRETGY
jgi:hypothetical protein